MTRSTLLRVAPIAMVAMAAGLGAYACIDSTAPLQSGGRTATLVITPAFTMEGAPSVVPPKKAHVIITRTTGEVALDTSVVLSSASIGAPALNQVQLASVVAPITVIVPLAASGVEDFAVRLALLSATGNVVFQGGPVNLRGDPAASALGTIQEVYVGTGATASSVTVTPGTVSLALGGTTTFTAHALSASGAELPGTPVQWTSLDPSIATFPDAASGRVVAGAAPGTAHIRATLLTGRTANATLVVQPSATSIAVQSGNGQSGLPGTAAAAPLVVIARAADGSGIAGVNVTFAIQSGGGSLSATQRTTGSDGSASVNFTFGPNPGPVVITASSAGLGGSPLTFNLAVLAGTPTQVSFTTQPTSGFVGTALTPIVVEVRDAGGNRVTTYSGSVSLALLTPPAGVTLSGATVAAVAGVATFSSVFVSGTAVGAQLVATATGVPGTATSSAFTVGVRPAVALGFSVQPPAVISALAVFPSSVVVRALDAVGGVVTSYTGIVSLTLDSPPAGVSLQGTTSATAVNGVATFADLTISAPAPSVRIIATGTGITGAFFSSSIVVNTSVNIFAGTPPSTTFTVQRAAASPAPATAQLTASSLQITGLAIGTITYGPGLVPRSA
jgi:hypothetical protein